MNKFILPVWIATIAMVGGQRGYGQQAGIDVAVQPPNGIYLVERWTIEREDLFPLFENEFFVEYDESRYQELDDGQHPPVKYIAFSRRQFPPFDLADDPQVERQPDGRPRIGLTFSADMAEAMEKFSRRYLGRQVATLVDGFHAAGKYKLSYNAASLCSGMYFVKLSSQGQEHTKKLLLVK